MKAIRVVLFSISLIASFHMPSAYAQPVSAAVGKALMQAKLLVQAGKPTEALKVVASLDAVPNKTEHEIVVISQMRTYATDKLQGH